MADLSNSDNAQGLIAQCTHRSLSLTIVSSKKFQLPCERWTNVEDVRVTALLQVGDAQFRSEIAEEESVVL